MKILLNTNFRTILSVLITSCFKDETDTSLHVATYASVCMHVSVWRCVYLCVKWIFFFIWVNVSSCFQWFQDMLSCSLRPCRSFIDLCGRFPVTSISLSSTPWKSQREISLDYCNYLGIFFPKCINSSKNSSWLLLFLTAWRWKHHWLQRCYYLFLSNPGTDQVPRTCVRPLCSNVT